MKKIFSLVLLILIAVGMFKFFQTWHHTSPLGVGTGRIAGVASDSNLKTEAAAPSNFHDIVMDPDKHADQQATVTGHVRGVGKYAGNRNIYTIAEGDDRILVIDDGPAPQEIAYRSVSGTVKVVGLPGFRRAYLLAVKDKTHFAAPTWAELKDYFTSSNSN